MQLQYDTLEAVPENERESFVEFKDGDKTLFLHKELAETKKEAFRFKGDLTQAQRKQEEAFSRLQELESAEAKRQADIESQEFERKKKNGQHDEILEFERKKWQAEKEVILAEKEQLKTEKIESKLSAVVTRISSLGIDATKKSLEMHARNDIKPNDDGDLVVHLDGKATSLTVDEYYAQVKDLYPHLVSESHGKGGVAKGGTGSVATSGNVNKAAEDAKKKGDLNGYLSQALKFK